MVCVQYISTIYFLSIFFSLQKAKISKSKRNNQKKNKLIKQGVIKKVNKPLKKVPNGISAVKKPKPVEEDESDQGEDLLDMVEDEDMSFLKSAITSRSYNIYNKVRYSE